MVLSYFYVDLHLFQMIIHNARKLIGTQVEWFCCTYYVKQKPMADGIEFSLSRNLWLDQNQCVTKVSFNNSFYGIFQQNQ